MFPKQEFFSTGHVTKLVKKMSGVWKYSFTHITFQNLPCPLEWTVDVNYVTEYVNYCGVGTNIRT